MQNESYGENEPADQPVRPVHVPNLYTGKLSTNSRKYVIIFARTSNGRRSCKLRIKVESEHSFKGLPGKEPYWWLKTTAIYYHGTDDELATKGEWKG